jgi:diguanylate cyclase (GGDEF)-like protein/PAS domain S-box-containing protein
MFQIHSFRKSGAVEFEAGSGVDVTEIRNERDRMAASAKRLMAFMDAFPGIAFAKDREGRFVYANRRFESVFGIEPGQVVGLTDSDFLSEQAAQLAMKVDREVWDSKEPSEPYEVVSESGDGRHWMLTKFIFEDDSPDGCLLGGTAFDVTQLRKAGARFTVEEDSAVEVEEQMRMLLDTQAQLHARKSELEFANARLQLLAATDPLSGLPNRRWLEERLASDDAMAARYGRSYSVCLVDIDNFKAYNDRLGHVAGDRLICSVGEVLRDRLRDTDFLARYAGEEFCIVLPETDIEGSVLLAERLRATVEAHWEPDTRVTISVGCATLSIGTDSKHGDAIDLASHALYWCKRNGRNRVVHVTDVCDSFVPSGAQSTGPVDGVEVAEGGRAG